ncbi:F-box/kelch-repeat protein At3g23880-like [Quercus lobata]|uniref:F-box/kelch-repeat protein At3g23880-like n=1 Tax=Quercus lobata TaxID=97700 RepID=UPI0012464134|nr:F-box/kelch-repeat protein At3g23880-like [Quercus lobata]
MTEYLPCDVFLEILHRLPVKSLIRFRCISKSWNSLITSPAFINSNLTRSHSNSNKLIVTYSDVNTGYKLIHEEDNDNNDSSSEQIQQLEFPNNFRRNFQVVGFVNGLFCLYDQSRYIVWNPCIRKSIALPNPSVTISFLFYLAFGFDIGLPNPSDTTSILSYLAFGFDSRINDYKLLRIAFQPINISATKPLVEVYSVNEGSWRITSGGDSYPPGVYSSNRSLSTAVSLNGAVYFAAYHSDARGSIVLSFDLGDEVFHVISLPNGNFKFEADIDILVFKGLISLICHEYMGERCSFFVMKEYGVVDSWTKLFTIDLKTQSCRVLAFRKNGLLLVQYELLLGWELCSYDLESQRVKNLGYSRRRSPGYSCADNYVENLFLLDKPNDAVSK